jgi:hypothetical protein
VHKQVIEEALCGVTQARSDVIERLSNDPGELVLSYLWGAAVPVPDFNGVVDIFKDICRRNLSVMHLYDRIPAFQRDPLLSGFRKEIKKVSIQS